MRFVPGLDSLESEHLFADDKHFEVADDYNVTYAPVRLVAEHEKEGMGSALLVDENGTSNKRDKEDSM